MTARNPEELTDQELLQVVNKRKSNSIINATLIGFLVGIVVYSVAKNSWGLFTLIPLFLIYKLVNKPKYDRKKLDEILRKRNLK